MIHLDPSPSNPACYSPKSPPNRPFLVPSSPPSLTPLTLWHLLSLDAPTVAASWSLFVAWTAGIHPSVLDASAIFLAVWMLYAADRLLDAQPLFAAPLHPELQSRHRFHHRHRTGFLRSIALASLPLLLLLHRTLPATLHLYILLATLLLVWLLLVHARPAPSATAHRLPKELAVGLFFPAAVFIPTVARVPHLRPALLPDALLFAALCTLNCLFLYAWEHPRSPGHAHPSTRWAVRHLTALALSCCFLAAALTAISPNAALRTTGMALNHPASVFLASGLSALLLLALHTQRHRIPALTLRALADLVLLTPVPVVLATLLRSHQHSLMARSVHVLSSLFS